MKIFPASFEWSRYVAWARLLLGIGALAADWFLPQVGSLLFSVALGIFLVFSLLSVVRKRKPAGALGLLALFGDTVFFLILADHATPHSIWLPALFFFYLMTEALVFYSPREVFLVATVCGLFCALAPQPQLANLARIVVAGGLVAVAFAVNRQRLRARIEEFAREAEAAREQARKAAEAERQRIASDFHDGPLQSFISLQMRLEIMRKVLERDFAAGMEELAQIQGLAQAQVRELRAFVRSMRPVEVDGANLFAAGRRVAENFQKESGITVTFTGGDRPVPLPPEISSEVLQMLRESLNNVQKHAGATRVAVGMEKTDRALEMAVDDNGRGFQFSGTYTLEELELLRMGPASLKRRARGLNADMTLESRPGRGAGLKFRIPLQ